MLDPAEHDLVRPLLRELMLGEQRHYEHPQLTEKEIEHDVANAPAARFTGENVILAARAAGMVVGLCWCVFFNPGTGLEAEVAEVYVDPGFRSQGVGRKLLQQAVELFRRRNVTFAAVWTRENNPQAVRVYEEAGFRRTEQLVLTWLPLPGR
ncbi:MAG TPA: GNAT family N-acetyltransferase [Candidatus Dormibacteraeota bacterium]|nr:GNAT family N-acetyltransferase [Candidatus Dormibacteraeota bacterium]